MMATATVAQRLLPQPKELLTLEGTFSLSTDTLILIPAQAGEEAFFSARQLQKEVRGDRNGRTAANAAVARLTLPIVKSLAPPRSENVILLICGPAQAAAFGLEPARAEVPETIAHASPVKAQSYTLTITPTRVVLYADVPAGLFYGVQTLRQLVRLHSQATGDRSSRATAHQQGAAVRLPALHIRDWPTLPYRGLMLDISRRKVPTLDTLKQLVAQLGHYKLNVLQLYTEHTFQFLRHPKIGAGCGWLSSQCGWLSSQCGWLSSQCGSLSSQDIVELDTVCRQHHVELMPNLQSFGHARNTLTIPEYQHLAETDLLWTLSPAFEETYTLLDELYADLLPAFTSTTFNVDCDETWDLGQGASRALAGEIGVGRVYLNHILRVHELAARYGRRIQVWGDILLHHPELIDEVPDDVTLLDWHYDPADEYPTVRTFAEAGRRFWVCPGVGSWNSIFPRLYGANVNIRNLVRDGVAAGAEGMLNTDWGDHGHYQPLGLSWYGYVFGAAQGWTGGTTSDEDFEAAFGPLFFGPEQERIMDALHQMARTNDLPNVYRPNRSHTILALFDEPLTGGTVEGDDALPTETLTEMRALAEEATATLDALAPDHPRALTLREMASAARLTAYAARKVTLSQKIAQELRPRHGLCDQGLTTDRIYSYILALQALDVELERLRAEFETLWLARARRSEMHIALGYFAGLRARYRAAIHWLEGQRQALLKGEPVDADLSTYNTGDYRTLWQTWPD